MPQLVTFRATDRNIEALPLQGSTLDKVSLQIPNGAYTVFPVFEGWRVAFLDRHLSRLDRTLDLLSIERHFDRSKLRQLSRACVKKAGFPSARVRLTLPASDPQSAVVTVEDWQPPPQELYQRGVRVVTTDLKRDMPPAKDTQFIAPRSKLFEQLPDGIYEAILCTVDGAMVEGSGSNFYAFIDGHLRIAPGNLIYGGVACSIVMDACAIEPPLSLRHEAVYKDDILSISEAMLSSSSRGVLPIIEIDGQLVGNGQPGPLFADLRRRYNMIYSNVLEDL